MTFDVPVVLLLAHNSYRVASDAEVHVNVGVESFVFEGPVMLRVPGTAGVADAVDCNRT